MNKNFTGILKTMFAAFIILQIIFYAKVYASNVDGTKLDTYIDNLHKTNRSMLSVSVSEKGHAVYCKTVGYIDPAFTIQSDVNTKYRIGELSKTFTVVMIMQMVEEKRIQLGTPISRFFPELPNGKNISIRDLLTERVSIIHYLPGGKYYKLIKSEYVFDELLNESMNISEENEFAFNNPNYLVLSLIIEMVSGKSYSQLLKERISDPIGLDNTFSGNNFKGMDACSFNLINGEWGVKGKWDLQSVEGAASIISTPKDLGTFMDALFRGNLVNEKSLKTMMTLNKEGQGMVEMKFGNRTGYSYSGNIDGIASQTIYFPADGISISFSINGNSNGAGNMMPELVKLIYGS